MEDHVFREGQPWGCVFSEHVCTLYLRLFETYLLGVLIIFIQIIFCAQNLLKLNETTHTVSHKFWLASTSILLGHREAHGSHWSYLETRSKDPGSGSIISPLWVPRDLLVSTMKVLTYYYNLLGICFHLLTILYVSFSCFISMPNTIHRVDGYSINTSWVKNFLLSSWREEKRNGSLIFMGE